jgi:hypothetical protein
MRKKSSKYHSKKVTVNGITYASQKEYERFCALSLLQRAGAIQDLKYQVPFELIPAQFEIIPTGEFYKRGELKGQPKTKRVCVEQSVKYVADFTYTENGKQIVEDSKGFRTADYKIKRKLMLYIHGIRIKET